MTAVRFALVTLLSLVSFDLSRAQQPGYALTDSIAIGGEGGWDYIMVDTAMHRLYASHGTRVEVVDVDRKTKIGTIEHTNGVHGIAVASDLGWGFTSNGRDSSVTVFDLKSLAVLGTIKLSERNPDAIAYDSFSHRIFTFNGGSQNATAIDAKSRAVVGTIPLGGKPEFAVSDGRGRIFVNIEDKSSVVAFDPVALKVLATWPLAPGEEPSGLAMDRDHRRLFSVCGNKLMIVLDADSGRVIASLPIGEGVDAAAFDPVTRLAFSSNGEGTVSVIREATPDSYMVAQTVLTRRGARTMALDERTHRIYLPTAHYGPPPAPTPERPRPRPSIVPETFTIIVVGR